MAYIIKARMQLMRDFGCYPAAHSAFLLNLGLGNPAGAHEAVLRKRYGWWPSILQKCDKVESVTVSRRLPGDRYHELAQKYLPKGTSGVISFVIKGGTRRMP